MFKSGERRDKDKSGRNQPAQLQRHSDDNEGGGGV